MWCAIKDLLVRLSTKNTRNMLAKKKSPNKF